MQCCNDILTCTKNDQLLFVCHRNLRDHTLWRVYLVCKQAWKDENAVRFVTHSQRQRAASHR